MPAVHYPDLNVGRGFYIPTIATIRSEIEAFASKAKHLAEQILSQNNPKAYTGPIIIHDHHYYQPWPMFWYDPGPRYVVIDRPSRDSKRNDDESARILIGVISTVAAAIALYSLGSSIASYRDSSQELADTQEFQGKLNFIPRDIEEKDQEKICKAYQIADLKGRICTRVKNSAINDIILKSSFFIGAGVTATAAFVNAPGLITAAGIGTLVAGGGLLFKWGFDSTDKSNIRDAEYLKAFVSELKKI